ncbi:MAG: guanylate kinase [Paludibacteraceae bacterium]|nr:guanylate kinase [Paludibacteraceae bacterium]
MSGKLIIISAPSGSGKSTLINHLVEKGFDFTFSISATSRAPRGKEQNGVEYYFLSLDEFRKAIEENRFLEYEEVYPGCFYGTLKEPIDNALKAGKNVILDIDVKGALNVKRLYPTLATTIFIQPPSVEALRERLIGRQTDSMEMIEKRVAKAAQEIAEANKFDVIIINDKLEQAQQDIVREVKSIIEA